MPGRGATTRCVGRAERLGARRPFVGTNEGIRAAADQDRRAAEFERLVETFEKESATTCESCGRDGVLSCTAARMRWYAVRCDECRDPGWILAAEWKEWRRRTQAD